MTTNFVNTVTPIQATYAQGAAITLKVKLTSNHGGKFDYRVCPRQTSLDDACFGANFLTRCVVVVVCVWGGGGGCVPPAGAPGGSYRARPSDE
jgi:hypothetical protein